jgi:hypothetical protein
MRKRSKTYRPKPMLHDTIQWIINGRKPVSDASEEIQTARIKNHMALNILRLGTGGRKEVDVIVAAFNMTEALARGRVGIELAADIRAGQDALYALAVRGANTGRFVFTGPELHAINYAMAIHDAQLDVCTVAEMEAAIRLVRKELSLKRARVIEMADEVAA